MPRHSSSNHAHHAITPSASSAMLLLASAPIVGSGSSGSAAGAAMAGGSTGAGSGSATSTTHGIGGGSGGGGTGGSTGGGHATFHVRVTIHELANVPLVSGSFSAKWRVKNHTLHTHRLQPIEAATNAAAATAAAAAAVAAAAERGKAGRPSSSSGGAATGTSTPRSTDQQLHHQGEEAGRSTAAASSSPTHAHARNKARKARMSGSWGSHHAHAADGGSLRSETSSLAGFAVAGGGGGDEATSAEPRLHEPKQRAGQSQAAVKDDAADDNVDEGGSGRPSAESAPGTKQTPPAASSSSNPSSFLSALFHRGLGVGGLGGKKGRRRSRHASGGDSEAAPSEQTESAGGVGLEEAGASSPLVRPAGRARASLDSTRSSLAAAAGVASPEPPLPPISSSASSTKADAAATAAGLLPPLPSNTARGGTGGARSSGASSRNASAGSHASSYRSFSAGSSDVGVVGGGGGGGSGGGGAGSGGDGVGGNDPSGLALSKVVSPILEEETQPLSVVVPHSTEAEHDEGHRAGSSQAGMGESDTQATQTTAGDLGQADSDVVVPRAETKEDDVGGRRLARIDTAAAADAGRGGSTAGAEVLESGRAPRVPHESNAEGVGRATGGAGSGSSSSSVTGDSPRSPRKSLKDMLFARHAPPTTSPQQQQQQPSSSSASSSPTRPRSRRSYSSLRETRAPVKENSPVSSSRRSPSLRLVPAGEASVPAQGDNVGGAPRVARTGRSHGLGLAFGSGGGSHGASTGLAQFASPSTTSRDADPAPASTHSEAKGETERRDVHEHAVRWERSFESGIRVGVDKARAASGSNEAAAAMTQTPTSASGTSTPSGGHYHHLAPGDAFGGGSGGGGGGGGGVGGGGGDRGLANKTSSRSLNERAARDEAGVGGTGNGGGGHFEAGDACGSSVGGAGSANDAPAVHWGSLGSAELRISVKGTVHTDASNGGSTASSLRLGYVTLNLAEYAPNPRLHRHHRHVASELLYNSRGPHHQHHLHHHHHSATHVPPLPPPPPPILTRVETRRYLLAESKTNATLKLSIEVTHASGSREYSVPPIRQGLPVGGGGGGGGGASAGGGGAAGSGGSASSVRGSGWIDEELARRAVAQQRLHQPLAHAPRGHVRSESTPPANSGVGGRGVTGGKGGDGGGGGDDHDGRDGPDTPPTSEVAQAAARRTEDDPSAVVVEDFAEPGGAARQLRTSTAAPRRSGVGGREEVDVAETAEAGYTTKSQRDGAGRSSSTALGGGLAPHAAATRQLRAWPSAKTTPATSVARYARIPRENLKVDVSASETARAAREGHVSAGGSGGGRGKGAGAGGGQAGGSGGGGGGRRGGVTGDVGERLAFSFAGAAHHEHPPDEVVEAILNPGSATSKRALLSPLALPNVITKAGKGDEEGGGSGRRRSSAGGGGGGKSDSRRGSKQSTTGSVAASARPGADRLTAEEQLEVGADHPMAIQPLISPAASSSASAAAAGAGSLAETQRLRNAKVTAGAKAAFDTSAMSAQAGAPASATSAPSTGLVMRSYFDVERQIVPPPRRGRPAPPLRSGSASSLVLGAAWSRGSGGIGTGGGGGGRSGMGSATGEAARPSTASSSSTSASSSHDATYRASNEAGDGGSGGGAAGSSSVDTRASWSSSSCSSPTASRVPEAYLPLLVGASSASSSMTTLAAPPGVEVALAGTKPAWPVADGGGPAGTALRSRLSKGSRGIPPAEAAQAGYRGAGWGNAPWLVAGGTTRVDGVEARRSSSSSSSSSSSLPSPLRRGASGRSAGEGGAEARRGSVLARPSSDSASTVPLGVGAGGSAGTTTPLPSQLGLHSPPPPWWDEAQARRAASGARAGRAADGRTRRSSRGIEDVATSTTTATTPTPTSTPGAWPDSPSPSLLFSAPATMGATRGATRVPTMGVGGGGGGALFSDEDEDEDEDRNDAHDDSYY